MVSFPHGHNDAHQQSELLVEGTAQYLHGSSLRSDDNLIARKDLLETCLDSAFM